METVYDFSEYRSFFKIMNVNEESVIKAIHDLNETYIDRPIYSLLCIACDFCTYDNFTNILNRLKKWDTSYTSYTAYLYASFIFSESEFKCRLFKYMECVASCDIKNYNDITSYLTFLYDTMNNDELSEFMDIRNLKMIVKKCKKSNWEYQFSSNIYHVFQMFVRNYKCMEIIYNYVYFISSLGEDTETKTNHARDDFIMRVMMNVDYFEDMLYYFRYTYYKEIYSEKNTHIFIQKKRKYSTDIEYFHEKKHILEECFSILMNNYKSMKFQFYLVNHIEYEKICKSDMFKLKQLCDTLCNDFIYESFHNEIILTKNLYFIYDVYLQICDFDYSSNGILCNDWNMFKDFFQQILSHFSFDCDDYIRFSKIKSDVNKIIY